MTRTVPVGKHFDNFDSVGYGEDNYFAEIELVDIESRPLIAAALALAMDRASIEPASLKIALDSCGGGLPVGPALSAMLLSAEGESIWTDKSYSGVRRGQETIWRGRRWIFGQPQGWSPDWKYEGWKWAAQEENLEQSGFGQLPMLKACMLGRSAFLDLDCQPEGYADAITNGCGIESSTSDKDVYRQRVCNWAKSAKPGGLVVRTLSQNSTGYVGGYKVEEDNDQVTRLPVWCPAVPVTVEEECDLLSDLVDIVGSGFVADTPVETGPHTWDGLGWIVGIRKG